MNPHKKAEFERQQQLLLAIHEQEKMESMKKMMKLQAQEERQARKREEIKEIVKSKVQAHSEQMQNYQKQFYVTKAAEVLKIFEKAATTDSKINIKKIKKNVLANLVKRNKDLEPSEEYWSVQLLIKLGIVPDPDAKQGRKWKPKMDIDERKRQLEELGLEVPRQNLAAFNKEMEQMAKENYQKLVDENSKKHTRDEVNILRKLGLSAEAISQLDPGASPFKDYALAEKTDFTTLMEAQKQFYEQLQAAYKEERERALGKARQMDDILANGTSADAGSAGSAAYPDLQEPADFASLPEKKQLEFARMKLLRLEEFCNNEKRDLWRGKKQGSFLENYTKGELDIFHDMMQKMIQSKAAEIFKLVRAQ